MAILIRAAAPVLSPERVLSAMATTYDAQNSKNPALKFSSPNLCHVQTVKAIKARGNVEDRIWLFGDTGLGSHQEVYHSLLTDEHNKVVCDAYGMRGHFLGTKGYHVPGLIPDDEGLTYTYLVMTPVYEWFDDYFDYARP